MTGPHRALQVLQRILVSTFKTHGRHLGYFKLQSDMIWFISVIVINASFTKVNKFSDREHGFSSPFSFCSFRFLLSLLCSLSFFFPLLFLSLVLFLNLYLFLPPQSPFSPHQAAPEIHYSRDCFKLSRLELQTPLEVTSDPLMSLWSCNFAWNL